MEHRAAALLPSDGQSLVRIYFSVKKHLTNRKLSDKLGFKSRNEAVIMRNLQFVNLHRDDDRQRM